MSDQENLANQQSTSKSLTEDVPLDLSLHNRQFENLSTVIEFDGDSDIPAAHQNKSTKLPSHEEPMVVDNESLPNQSEVRENMSTVIEFVGESDIPVAHQINNNTQLPSHEEPIVVDNESLPNQSEVRESLSTYIEFVGESDIPAAHQNKSTILPSRAEPIVVDNGSLPNQSEVREILSTFIEFVGESDIPAAHQNKSTKLPSRDEPIVVDDESLPNLDAEAKKAEPLPKALDLTLPYAEHHLPTNVEVNITNVVCAYKLGCRVNFIDIIKKLFNVEVKLDQVYLRMRLRKPAVTATIWNSGSVSVMGATNKTEAHIAARRIARIIQKMGYPVRMYNFRIVNVAASCIMPWAIKLQSFIDVYPTYCSFEPELISCAVYHMPEPKACFFIFPTGSVNLTAKSVEDIHSALNKLYRQLRVFTKPRTPEQMLMLQQKDMRLKQESVNALFEMAQK